jgi:hypothetical protein
MWKYKDNWPRLIKKLWATKISCGINAIAYTLEFKKLSLFTFVTGWL